MSTWMGDLHPQIPSRWPRRAPLWAGEKADEGLARGTGAWACATSHRRTRPVHSALSKQFTRRLNTTCYDNGERRVDLHFGSALH